jgi:hypothetical protein
MTKSWTVVYHCEYDVVAETEDDAIEIALEMHAELPDGVWEAIEEGN